MCLYDFSNAFSLSVTTSTQNAMSDRCKGIQSPLILEPLPSISFKLIPLRSLGAPHFIGPHFDAPRLNLSYSKFSTPVRGIPRKLMWSQWVMTGECNNWTIRPIIALSQADPWVLSNAPLVNLNIAQFLHSQYRHSNIPIFMIITSRVGSIALRHIWDMAIESRRGLEPARNL